MKKIQYWVLMCGICGFAGFYVGVEMATKKAAQKMHVLDRAFDASSSITTMKYLHEGAVEKALLHHDYSLYDIAKEFSNTNPKDTPIINFVQTINKMRVKYGSGLDTDLRYPLNTRSSEKDGIPHR